jgi:uncharacterized protein (TIGR02186 family)
MIARLLAALLLLSFAAPAAQAERLVSAVSRTVVAITSSFAGETLTLFGNIEPEVGAEQRFVEGPFHVIIVVTGPLQDRVARRKSNVAGIWINTEQAVFESFPSFYHVLASGRLTDITDPITLAENSIPLAAQARFSPQAGWWDSLAFGSQLVRLMEEEGRFGLNERGVAFRSETLYSAQVTLPADVPPGLFLARTYLFKDGALISQRADGFSVRKTGFERFLGEAAIRQPLLYGLAAVILALFTGWLGGVVFRR